MGIWYRGKGVDNKSEHLSRLKEIRGVGKRQVTRQVRLLFDLLYGAVPADFESAFGLEESVRRLSAATERSVFGALTHQAAVGHVSKDRVSLQRVIPFVGNSFKSFYLGEFKETNGSVLLTGRFTMLWWAKAFMTLWFGFCVLWTGLAIVPLLIRDANAWCFPFAGAGMFIFGATFVVLCKRLSRNDISWLSKIIQDALSNEPPNSRFQSDTPQAGR